MTIKKRSPDYFPYAREIAIIILKTYGRQTLDNKRDPFDELLFIILSSKTPPQRYSLTYSALKQRYQSANSLAKVSPSEIAQVIAIGGLAEKKAIQISNIACKLVEEYGEATLWPLANVNDKDAEAFLDALPGIGKKMARCVLMYSLGRQVFPVDAHCFRICKRLGWISENATLTDRIADKLQEGIPPRQRRVIHVGMILVGREYCLPRNPHCQSCPLSIYCPTGHRNELSNQITKVGI